jgi:hypothetical protein
MAAGRTNVGHAPITLRTGYPHKHHGVYSITELSHTTEQMCDTIGARLSVADTFPRVAGPGGTIGRPHGRWVSLERATHLHRRHARWPTTGGRRMGHHLAQAHIAGSIKVTLPRPRRVGFLLHRPAPAVAGLTRTPQAFFVSGCPTATCWLNRRRPSVSMFCAAFRSRL